MNKQKVASAFYFGTLLSSVGSMTFTLSAVTFMLRAGYTVADVALLIGLSRFLPLLSTALLGDLADRVSPRKVVLVSEILAIVLSVGILLTWEFGKPGFLFFVSFVVARACIVGVQTGGRSKIAKLLSGLTYYSNAKNAIWLNKVTQGSTFFAGILGWIAAQTVSFEFVIAFDSLTFFANGIILWFLPMPSSSVDVPETEKKEQRSFLSKFSDLYRHAPSEAKLDLTLALVMCGFWSFSARTAEIAQASPSLLLISFGAAVWLSGFLERALPSTIPDFAWWFLLASGFATYGLFDRVPTLILLSAFIKDLAYWAIFHRLTARIQVKTPESKMAGVASARYFQMIAILSLGEFGVGLWQSSLPLGSEALLRAFISVLVLASMVWSSKLFRGIHETTSDG